MPKGKHGVLLGRQSYADAHQRRTKTGFLATGADVLKDAARGGNPDSWETPARVDDVTDALLEQKLPDIPRGGVRHTGDDEDGRVVTEQGWESLRQGDFWAVARRAFANLERNQQVRKAGSHAGPRYSLTSMKRLAEAVAGYHVWRHTPAALRDKVWPKDIHEVAMGWSMDSAQLREALYESRYRKWEERFLLEPTKAVRAAFAREVLDESIQRQRDVEDPAKINANLFRVVLTTNDAMPRAESKVNVNVHNNTLALSLSAEELQAAHERVKLYAKRRYGEEAALEEPARNLPDRPVEE